MKIIFAPKNRGIAVIVALVAVTVLTMLAGAFAYSMKVESRLAANADNDEQLLWLGRAGMERARWILSIEGNLPFTSLNQIWAGGPGDGPETNSPLNGISLDNFQVGEGTVSLKMTELESRINVNLADTPLIQQVMTTMGADAGDMSVVADAIQDWVDTDDATRPAGAESDFYQGLTPAYYAKNAPIDNISELQYIKGITLPLFKGGRAANDPGAAFQRHLRVPSHLTGSTPDYPFGFEDVFTPFSTGKINLNTANETVLQLIPGMDTLSAQAVIKFRSGEGGADGSGAFKNLGQLSAIGLSPQVSQQMSRYVDVRGSTYEVHATARIGDYSREYIAILFRNGPNVDVFSFYWK
jgi:type II secretory pathway component PulK